MEDSYFHQSPVSISKTIASSGPFQIELMKYVGTDDYVKLIDISESLVKEYGKAAKLHQIQFKHILIEKGLFLLSQDIKIKLLVI